MKFPGVDFLETTPKFTKRKKNSSSCVYVLHKTSHQEISRPSRAVTATKCTKKCDARGELFLWLFLFCLRSLRRCYKLPRIIIGTVNNIPFKDTRRRIFGKGLVSMSFHIPQAQVIRGNIQVTFESCRVQLLFKFQEIGIGSTLFGCNLAPVVQRAHIQLYPVDKPLSSGRKRIKCTPTKTFYLLDSDLCAP